MNSARQQKHTNGAFGSPTLIPIPDTDLFLQHTTDNYRPLNPQQLAALSLLPAFRQQIYDIQNSRAQLNYGLNKVRFPGVVPAGSQLRGRASLAPVVDRDEAADIIVEYTVERDGADKPVCVAESVVRVLF